MHPISPKKQKQENHGADAPGQWVCPEYDPDIRNQTHCQCDVADTEQTPYTEQNDHGHGSIAGTPEYSRDTVSKCQ